MVVGDEPFLRDMLENPGAGTRLVWCDWLEERGDPRADHYRYCAEIIEEVDDLYPNVPNDLAIIWNVFKAKIVNIAVTQNGRSYRVTNACIVVYYNKVIYTNIYMPIGKSYSYWRMYELHTTQRPKKIPESIVPLIVQVAVKYAIKEEAWPLIRHRNPCREIPISMSQMDEEREFYNPNLGEPYEQEKS